MSTNDYTIVSLATDIYTYLNNGMPERNVAMNITAIPNLCNLMGIPKIAQKGVYLGVNKQLSLMMVDEHHHKLNDFDLKFYEVVKSKFGIPFVEKHVALIKYNEHVEIPHLDDIFSMCRLADFIVDE